MLTPSHAASAAPPRSCSSCLHVANLVPSGKQRAILILAGRSLDGSPRPNGALADFLEGANADLDLNFEQRAVNSAPSTIASWSWTQTREKRPPRLHAYRARGRARHHPSAQLDAVRSRRTFRNAEPQRHAAPAREAKELFSRSRW